LRKRGNRRESQPEEKQRSNRLVRVELNVKRKRGSHEGENRRGVLKMKKVRRVPQEARTISSLEKGEEVQPWRVRKELKKERNQRE